MSSNHTPEYRQLPLWDDAPQKKCTKCGNSYPATTAYWYPCPKGKYGLNSRCKDCHHVLNKEYRNNNPEKEAARKSRWRKDNLEHNAAYARQWRKNNPEKNKAIERRAKTKHRDYYREYNKRWHKNNAEHVKEYRRQYRKDNREQVRQRHINWVNRNRDRVRIHWNNRRVRKHNAQGSHTIDQIYELLRRQSGYCFCCGTDIILDGFHRDHWIPLSKGGSNDIDNIRLLCKLCNLSKGAKMPDEWSGYYH